MTTIIAGDSRESARFVEMSPSSLVPDGCAMKKVVPFLLVLLSVVLGAVFGWHRAGRPDLRELFRRPAAPRSTPAPAPRRPPPESPDPEPEAPETPAPPPPAAPLALAKSLFQDLQFAEAREAFGEAARSGDAATGREARRMEFLSDIFDRATRGVPRTLSAQAPQEVTLANDRVVIGYATTDEDGNVTLVTNKGITATFRADEVVSVERVETAAWRASCEAELQERLREAEDSPSPALDYYQAAYYSIRNGLADRAADLLLRSSESEGFTMVIETFGGDDAHRLLRTWEEILHPSEEPPPPASVPKPAATGGVSDLVRADELYHEGLLHYRRSWPGMKNAAAELKKAREIFQEAQKVYESASETRPDDRVLNERIQSLQTLIYDCIKRASL